MLLNKYNVPVKLFLDFCFSVCFYISTELYYDNQTNLILSIHSLFSYSLFIDKERITTKIEDHLKLNDPEGILKVFPYEGLQEALRELGKSEKKIWVRQLLKKKK